MSFRLKEKAKKLMASAPLIVAPSTASPAASSSNLATASSDALTAGTFSVITFPPLPTLISAPEKKPARGGPRTLLTLKLRHGDITVMEGGNVQKFYEHSIKTVDGLRFGGYLLLPPLVPAPDW